MGAHRCPCGFAQKEIQSHRQKVPCTEWTPSYSRTKISTSQGVKLKWRGKKTHKINQKLGFLHKRLKKHVGWQCLSVMTWNLSYFEKTHKLSLGSNGNNHLLGSYSARNCAEHLAYVFSFNLCGWRIWALKRLGTCSRSKPKLSRPWGYPAPCVLVCLCSSHLPWSA